jgi:hypothetical protein
MILRREPIATFLHVRCAVGLDPNGLTVEILALERDEAVGAALRNSDVDNGRLVPARRQVWAMPRSILRSGRQ